ncbi:hypothetical protein AX16_008723 [Volvariella volvacea WC 439]|nr:hypothetical protein AX16_008723 [Volvariella volvacea WC 439]
MIKSIAVISLLVASVLGQSSSSSAAPAESSPNPLIPEGISSDCRTFLTDLNSDPSLTACTASLISATSAYGPGGDSGANTSYAAVTSALNNLCSTSTNDACPVSLIRGKLAEFYPACQAELTTQANPGVLAVYEVLYSLAPFKNAICSKGDDGNFCVIETPVAPTLGRRSSIARRADAITPNIEAYRESNLLFLFLNPDLENSVLCTACTRNILAAYISFESDIPYAPGLAQSDLLGGQSALYASVQTKCGSNFLSGPVQAAGGLGGGSSIPFLGRSAAQGRADLQGPFAALAGVITLAAASFL